jgi:hypothetical protein
MKRLILSIVCVLVLSAAGCGTAKEADDTSGYYFESRNTKISLNDEVDAVIEKLGNPSGGIYEANSCAFEGKDTFYYYDGFTLLTYESADKRCIYNINLEDDTVSTAEGVHIGNGFPDMVARYGTQYVNSGNAFVYTKNKTTLTFVIEDDKITGITYALKEK